METENQVYITPDWKLNYWPCEWCIKTDKTKEEVNKIPSNEIKDYVDEILEESFWNGSYKGSF